MTPKLGLVGLPNVGKSTLFKYLTQAPAEVAAYPFTTIDVNKGFLNIEDPKLKKIFELIKSKKLTFAQIEFFDVAGLIKGAHKGEGLGNQFLADIRPCEGIFEIVRNFENQNAPTTLNKIDPLEELDILNLEIILSDLQILENNEAGLIREKKTGAKESKIKLEELIAGKEILGKNQRLDAKNFSEIIKEFNLISSKPLAVILNSSKEPLPDLKKSVSQFFRPPLNQDFILSGDLKLLSELTDLPEEERKEFAAKNLKEEIIETSLRMLDLIIFYTVNENECRSWITKKGQSAKEAAGEIHGDFKEKFIKAEVISMDELIKLNGDWGLAHHKGLIRTEGKEYPIKNGEVMLIKI